MSEANKKAMIIGLDCAAPKLIFEDWKSHLPNLSKLMEEGGYGKLKSSDPPITCPAWMSMMSSKSPGKLGFYGFRNRKDYSYDKLKFATSASVKEDLLWDVLGRNKKKSIILGVPQTYPPKRINGCLVTSFLTPSTDAQFTYPSFLKEEIKENIGDYIIDVRNFRTEDKDNLLEEIYEMTKVRFKTARYLLDKKPWDFFMMVEMGVDRIHHGFWKYHDKNHPKYEPGNKYENAIKDYYKYVDKEIGTLLERTDDDTLIMVVSDHGAKKMDGGIAINEWLIEKGYLKIKARPNEATRIRDIEIDWDNTKAWAFGGYYSRIFLNVKDREPNGMVKEEEYEQTRDELIKTLEGITDEDGNSLGTRVLKPQEIYEECKNIPPDLIAYFGDLDWRAIGSIYSKPKKYIYANDTGPDDANHDHYGIYISNKSNKKKLSNLDLRDITPTVLDYFGIEIPKDMEGKVINR
ncbi:alkaline phosphatase family protein [Orenia marismortui]|uniref:Putative AlkP superfamily phosphohydrolase/phosphomutase n=1 Tax=Orenia marismortui TaxID=46469 RepID=A0A4V3H016_9FIRM|nr:alkaline phosphatase family protein [Orenia marismortui]TDX58909.1 putative AlkP superfamily phosphohydrolase/phosphomutase [Orenia marismortui]